MTNFEFWKDKLKEIKTNKICVGEEGIPIRCDRAYCLVCIFGDCIDDDTCFCHFDREVMKWLLSEHIEKPKLTKRERAFCEFVESGFIVRSACGEIGHYTSKPKKIEGRYWDGERITCVISTESSDGLFPFIRWEDDEPWQVEDLLKLEVKEDE